MLGFRVEPWRRFLLLSDPGGDPPGGGGGGTPPADPPAPPKADPPAPPKDTKESEEMPKWARNFLDGLKEHIKPPDKGTITVPVPPDPPPKKEDEKKPPGESLLKRIVGQIW